MIIVRFSKPGKRREYLPLALFHIAFIAIAVTTGFWWVGALWYLSLVTSFMMFFRLRTILEHLGTGGTHRLHLNWWQCHLIAPHNIWYHWEHHRYPTIAYHRLRQVRELLPERPVISLGALIRFLGSARVTASGEVLKERVVSQFESKAEQFDT